MESITPISSYEEVNNDSQQPPITGSPPIIGSLPLPIEYLDHHQQFTDSISPSLPPKQPENSADRQQRPQEDVEDQRELPAPPYPPPEENFDRQQTLEPPSPPPTGAQPPENFRRNRETPILNQPLSPSTPTAAAKDQVEIPDYGINSNPTPDHESPFSKQSPSSETNDHVASPNYHKSPNPNHNLDHESLSPSSPAKFQVNPNPKDPSPSPPPTTGSPSSPPDTVEPNTMVTPPLGVPLLHAAVGSSLIKPQISPWTPQETANLIQAYQEKWYSLKKGPLKAGQWEEVAITVAARCGYDEPTKTAKQCRHKLEKLRKRYRTERAKPRSKAIAWNFFKLMDNLEKGPLPISSTPPMAMVEYQKPSSSNGKKRKTTDDDDDDESDHEYLVNKRSSRSKNYDHHVSNGYLTRNLRFTDGGNRVVKGLRTPVVHKHKGFYKEDDGDDEEEEEEEEKHDSDNGGNNDRDEEGVAAQLAVEIKGFAEKFVKMENKKIEMIRDVERYRLEMENKRIQMILESQRMLVETVNKAFNKTHKLSN
ncbi:hypothetical protein R6Q59_017487 [Mikania micrantha]|uniref:Myb-like domain-containing protein n=1 Tax=Mikania micrantha TaxID=192012 RepID=A0A5N6M4K1_9ASTR|nr:hypothetical protein E3N88_36376 [Mikania micrantha]